MCSLICVSRQSSTDYYNTGNGMFSCSFYVKFIDNYQLNKFQVTYFRILFVELIIDRNAINGLSMKNEYSVVKTIKNYLI